MRPHGQLCVQFTHSHFMEDALQDSQSDFLPWKRRWDDVALHHARSQCMCFCPTLHDDILQFLHVGRFDSFKHPVASILLNVSSTCAQNILLRM